MIMVSQFGYENNAPKGTIILHEISLLNEHKLYILIVNMHVCVYLLFFDI